MREIRRRQRAGERDGTGTAGTLSDALRDARTGTSHQSTSTPPLGLRENSPPQAAALPWPFITPTCRESAGREVAWEYKSSPAHVKFFPQNDFAGPQASQFCQND